MSLYCPRIITRLPIDFQSSQNRAAILNAIKSVWPGIMVTMKSTDGLQFIDAGENTEDEPLCPKCRSEINGAYDIIDRDYDKNAKEFRNMVYKCDSCGYEYRLAEMEFGDFGGFGFGYYEIDNPEVILSEMAVRISDLCGVAVKLVQARY